MVFFFIVSVSSKQTTDPEIPSTSKKCAVLIFETHKKLTAKIKCNSSLDFFADCNRKIYPQVAREASSTVRTKTIAWEHLCSSISRLWSSVCRVKHACNNQWVYEPFSSALLVSMSQTPRIHNDNHFSQTSLEIKLNQIKIQSIESAII